MINPPKTLAEARKYLYGNFNKQPYREGYCVVEVQEPGRGIHFYQCGRKAVTGPDNLFCKQHDPAAVAARAKASADQWNAASARNAKNYDIGALQRAAQLLARSNPDAAQACRDLVSRMRETK